MFYDSGDDEEFSEGGEDAEFDDAGSEDVDDLSIDQTFSSGLPRNFGEGLTGIDDLSLYQIFLSVLALDFWCYYTKA